MDYGSATQFDTPGIVTGKPVELGGSFGREAATGRGVSIITGRGSDQGIDIEGARIIIQAWERRILYGAAPE